MLSRAIQWKGRCVKHYSVLSSVLLTGSAQCDFWFFPKSKWPWQANILNWFRISRQPNSTTKDKKTSGTASESTEDDGKSMFEVRQNILRDSWQCVSYCKKLFFNLKIHLIFQTHHIYLNYSFAYCLSNHIKIQDLWGHGVLGVLFTAVSSLNTQWSAQCLLGNDSMG